MLKIEEIEYNEFLNGNFDFTVGEYATYNHYYLICLKNFEKEITVGLQTIYAGIPPQIDLIDEKILIGAGEDFYVYDFMGNLVKKISIGSVFYNFLIQNKYILVVCELDIMLLNNFFNLVWEKHFNEIIDLKMVENETIELIDYNENSIKLNYWTGEKIS